MTVEAPGHGRVTSEPFGRSHVDEGQTASLEGRIRAPEALVPSEVRQTGIHPHSCARGDEQRLGTSDGFGSSLDIVFVHITYQEGSAQGPGIVG